MAEIASLILKWYYYRGQILPAKSSSGKPDHLICMYTATGHNNAVLSLDVMGDLMITGSKGWFTLVDFYRLKFVSYGVEAQKRYPSIDSS